MEAGKFNFPGNIFINEPDKIVSVTVDNFGELLFLLTYCSTDDTVYTPTWVYSWLVS